MGISDHLTCLLQNLYAGQETTVRTRHELTDWFQTAARQASLSITISQSWLKLMSPSIVIMEPKKIQSVTVSIISTSICHEVIRLDAMIFVF